MEVSRGELYWADLVPRSGSEQRGRRPVIVISDDSFNNTPNWKSIIVIPLSMSQMQAKRGPTVVELSTAATGLNRTSVALCHQITTLDRTKITQRIGVLARSAISLVEGGIKAALDIE